MNVGESKAPRSLAERFWSLARGMENASDSTEPAHVVEHVLAVLDALAAGVVGRDLTVNTVNFLTLLRQHEVKGDLLYASPEQARGEQVDERSLVFSVGVLLFEKLTGRHPFGAEGNPQRLARIRRGEIGSGVNYFPRVPAQLRVVLVKAMGPFPEERWNTLVELRAELEIFLTRARSPNNAGPPPSVSRPLPALPGDSPPAERVTRRRLATAAPSPAAPSVDLPRMATMSGRLSAIAVERDRAGDPAETARIAQVRVSEVVRRGLPPGAWAFGGVLVGVVVTSLVFLAAWPRRAASGAGAPAEVAARPGPGAATTPTAAVPAAMSAVALPAVASPTASRRAAAPSSSSPHSPVAAPPDGVAPRADPRTAAAPSRRASAATPAGAFDPEAGGQIALAAIRPCFAADRRIQFGASLVYDQRTGRSRRIYFGAVQGLQPEERACLEPRLLDLAAGGIPEQAEVVTYSFHLATGGDQVKAHLHPPG